MIHLKKAERVELHDSLFDSLILIELIILVVHIIFWNVDSSKKAKKF